MRQTLMTRCLDTKSNYFAVPIRQEGGDTVGVGRTPVMYHQKFLTSDGCPGGGDGRVRNDLDTNCQGHSYCGKSAAEKNVP